MFNILKPTVNTFFIIAYLGACVSFFYQECKGYKCSPKFVFSKIKENCPFLIFMLGCYFLAYMIFLGMNIMYSDMITSRNYISTYQPQVSVELEEIPGNEGKYVIYQESSEDNPYDYSYYYYSKNIALNTTMVHRLPIKDTIIVYTNDGTTPKFIESVNPNFYIKNREGFFMNSETLTEQYFSNKINILVVPQNSIINGENIPYFTSVD